jgi:hypothetical protein
VDVGGLGADGEDQLDGQLMAGHDVPADRPGEPALQLLAARVGQPARLHRTSMALGRTATITGQVAPAHRGQQIRLQQKRGRTWHTTQKKTLPASGRYGFGVRPRTTGTSWWRIYKASDTDHIGAISAAFRPVVYRAAITGIHAYAAGDDRSNLNGEYALVRNTAQPPSTWPAGNWMPGIAASGSPWPATRSRRAPRCGSTPVTGPPGLAICSSGRAGRSGTTTATPPPSSTPTTSPSAATATETP